MVLLGKGGIMAYNEFSTEANLAILRDLAKTDDLTLLERMRKHRGLNVTVSVTALERALIDRLIFAKVDTQLIVKYLDVEKQRVENRRKVLNEKRRKRTHTKSKR